MKKLLLIPAFMAMFFAGSVAVPYIQDNTW